MGCRDPVTGTEQIGSIIQDSQARLGISMKSTAFCQPFYSSNVLNCMRVSTWDIPKDREEATSLRSLLGYDALLDNIRPHFWWPATPAASAKEVASMLGSPSLSPRKPIHRMAKAALDFSRQAWWRVPDKVMPRLRNCRVDGRGVVFQELSDFPRE